MPVLNTHWHNTFVALRLRQYWAFSYMLDSTGRASFYPGQYWSVSVYIESWTVSPARSQSVITHNHGLCGVTDACMEFAVLSTPCYFELGAAKVEVLFNNRLLFLIFWLSLISIEVNQCNWLALKDLLNPNNALFSKCFQCENKCN